MACYLLTCVADSGRAERRLREPDARLARLGKPPEKLIEDDQGDVRFVRGGVCNNEDGVLTGRHTEAEFAKGPSHA